MNFSFVSTRGRHAAAGWATVIALGLAAPGLAAPGLDAADAAGAASKAPGSAQRLPVTSVILYSSGVGYFERQGQVEGTANIELRFRTEDINDLLKSMVVQDADGGRIRAVTYGSRDPVAKTLRSFGIDLTSNPSLGQLLNQVRGERAEVFWPNRTIGTILGIESKVQSVGENKQIQVEFLNVVTDDGLQSLPMSQVQKLKLENERLNGELKQALEVLASSHDTQKKSVSIAFEGQGKRKVSVSYITQAPVWKTSYRLVLDEKEKPFLQGWAIVENTTDEDWENVRFSLVSGRPISFIMDLYQPLYAPRPLVVPELYTSLRPQVYGDSLERAAAEPSLMVAAAPSPLGVGLAMRKSARDEAAGRRFNALAESVETRVAGSAGGEGKLELSRGVDAAAQGGSSGELFEYRLGTPVTLARQKSAMLPIINQNTDGERVSIFNANTHAKHPLYGFRLKNTTPLHLMQGPITVFDADAYAGDARIEDLAPGQDRLISYGLDLKTEVESQPAAQPVELVGVQIKKGLLIASRRLAEDTVYTVQSRDQKAKSLLIEHPHRFEYQLLEPKQAAERTRDFYRFALKADPGKTAKLTVKEERQLSETVQLSSLSSDLIGFYLRAQRVGGKVKEALQKAMAMRDRTSKTTAERTRREQRVKEITDEHSRIRDNMARLSQSSELYGRYVKKLDQQETELENLRQEIEGFKTTEAGQKRELDDYLLGLDVE